VELCFTASRPTHQQEIAVRVTPDQFQQTGLLPERNSARKQPGRLEIFQPDPETLGHRFEKFVPAAGHAGTSLSLGENPPPVAGFKSARVL
jgi:hypothetical protein